MSTKSKNIPVNAFSTGAGTGIYIGKALFNGSSDFEDVQRSHRDNAHSFILQEKGSTQIEIDFQKYDVKAPSIIYIHPNQVHRVISFKNATINSLMISNENLRPEFLDVLNELTPVHPISLKTDTYTILAETVALCIKLSERKAEKLYHSILKESCNTLVASVISQYLAHAKPAENYSRPEAITRIFKLALEQHFITVKSPKEYARQLNVSAPYLNECVKNATGFPVSYHILQRVVLEAKRMLYHSDKAIKEVAGDLGYDDYSYFSRMFGKITGLTPIAFRNKNLE